MKNWQELIQYLQAGTKQYHHAIRIHLYTKHYQGYKMNEKQKIKTGKFISLILRHDPQKIGIELDSAGWASVDELLQGLNNKGHAITFEQLDDLVTSNDKQRYRFNEDKTQICANQGHSLTLDLELEELAPPEILYHGTATRFMKSIKKQGLIKGSRHHVHLSADEETMRHGMPVILSVLASAMHDAGFSFYRAENAVWLVDHVPANFLI